MAKTRSELLQVLSVLSSLLVSSFYTATAVPAKIGLGKISVERSARKLHLYFPSGNESFKSGDVQEECSSSKKFIQKWTHDKSSQARSQHIAKLLEA